MKYRKKPVVIEAVEWNGTNTNEIWAMVSDLKVKPYFEEIAGNLHVSTLEGIMRATPGDFIIRDVKGELYPCKPDIFAATYEAAD